MGYILLIIYFIINNIKTIKKYYYPATNKLVISLKRLIQRKTEEIKQIKTYKEKKAPEKFRSDLYLTINPNKLKFHQDKLSFNYSIGVLNLNSDLNIGAIYRTGCLLGMKKYYIFGKKIYYPKSQVGIDLVDIEYIDIFPKLRDRYDQSTLTDFNEKIFIDFFNRNELIPIIIEQGGKNLLKVNFTEFPKNNNYIFIFGNEKFGVPKKMIEMIKRFQNHLIISIPQWGCAHSYNVSQAANIVMWEYYRQNIMPKFNLLR